MKRKKSKIDLLDKRITYIIHAEHIIQAYRAGTYNINEDVYAAALRVLNTYDPSNKLLENG
jgi:hypothetical protein